MITLKSSASDGSLFQVYDNDTLIGIITKHRGASGDMYKASICREGKLEYAEKDFNASHQALKWIEISRGE
jgi:hypothetical protein